MATGLAGDKPASGDFSSCGGVWAPNGSAPFSLLPAGGFLPGLKPESLDARDRLGRG